MEFSNQYVKMVLRIKNYFDKRCGSKTDLTLREEEIKLISDII